MDFQKDVTERILELEREIDRLKRSSVWEDWTPTVTQGVAVTISLIEAKYLVEGQRVSMYAVFTATSNGTAGQSIVIGGIPSAATPASSLVGVFPLGLATVVDVGVSGYSGFIFAPSSATSWFFLDTVTHTNIGLNPNFGLVNADSIQINAMYRRA